MQEYSLTAGVVGPIGSIKARRKIQRSVIWHEWEGILCGGLTVINLVKREFAQESSSLEVGERQSICIREWLLDGGGGEGDSGKSCREDAGGEFHIGLMMERLMRSMACVEGGSNAYSYTANRQGSKKIYSHMNIHSLTLVCRRI